MKNIILIIFCSLVMTSAGLPEFNKTSNVANLEGVWELEHQFMYENNEVSDTIFNPNGYRQIKMFSKGKVMWTRFDPADGNEWFGYGSYTVKDNTLEEFLEYASDPMMKIIDTTEVFRFELQISKDHFRQIDLNKDGTFCHSENYKRIE
ncbi:hypothetical protein [Aquimarina brevivitae]|uniref:Lipocalin-like protein n=1 Tax=Aquimarina brevivitae TaxID=323412 RepID=A0A4Q7PMK6_9FLAO|nr:hypothetical protein [Aquimarina brevivitae]RZT00253.1 hypothetical protein EV197_1489 [Aquimarina brevivitae]